MYRASKGEYVMNTDGKFKDGSQMLLSKYQKDSFTSGIHVPTPSTYMYCTCTSMGHVVGLLGSGWLWRSRSDQNKLLFLILFAICVYVSFLFVFKEESDSQQLDQVRKLGWL